ncbi:BON domain-containing protein [Salsipaludibacter albus]|uniref:BON domain-containing protein n=1 Tax=Salsipaludibacter albus TaxID=2849650 RepID=UPI001EE42AB2|nr:BON domain-containing protein [Salsipaludibacter albus]MBY5160932.1 BON domain-containing protein [Salsipaludibacter albus]
MAATTTDHDDAIGDRVAARFDDLRDRTAGALSSEESPAFRELGRVRHRLDDVEERLSDQLTALGRQQATLTDELHSASKRTTFPRKLFWMVLGGAAAAAATWLSDPDRGKARRNQLADQVGSQARDLGDQARSQAGQAVNRAKGAVAEAGRDVLPEDVPNDPQVLQQRIKSQVFGHRDDVQDVVLTIGQPGEVTLKGTVRSADSEQELLAAVADVEGVTRVDNELTVAAS